MSEWLAAGGGLLLGALIGWAIGRRRQVHMTLDIRRDDKDQK